MRARGLTCAVDANGGTVASLADGDLAALRAEMAALRAEVAALREELDARPSWSRRAVLGAGAAAAAVVATLGPVRPAAAVTGAFEFGTDNDAGTSATTLTSSAINGTLRARNTNAAVGVYGEATGAGDGVQGISLGGGRGVYGYSTSGVSVYGEATGAGSGVRGTAGAGGIGVHGTGGSCGVLAQGSGSVAARFVSAGASGPPTGGSNSIGMVSAPADGSLWVCVEAGTPGVWRQVASKAAAGAFVPITPARVFDSRYLTPVGPLASGANRTVSVATAYLPDSTTVAIGNVVPAGSTAVAVNLTITDTTGAGYLFLAPGNATAVTASSINWTAPGTTVANALVVPLDTARQLKAFAGGGGSAHFLLDVSGYYR